MSSKQPEAYHAYYTCPCSKAEVRFPRNEASGHTCASCSCFDPVFVGMELKLPHRHALIRHLPL